MWTCPPYNLDTLQAQARARLVAMGENPQDRLKVYQMVAVLRGEELRASRHQGDSQRPQRSAVAEGFTGPRDEGDHSGDAMGVKREVPVATSARIGVLSTQST